MRFCTYCGEPADTLDHTVPMAFTSVRRRRGRKGGDCNGCPRVDCCRECNTLLGSRLLVGVDARKAWLHEELQRRYRKLLSAPKEDLRELGPGLRAIIAGRSSRKAQVERRIAFAGGRSR